MTTRDPLTEPFTREIQLLGGVRVCLEGARIEADASPRAILLLTALALEGGRPVDRGELAYLLWPESSDQQARTNLRKVVHELRSWLDDTWVEIDQRRLRLRTENVRVDIDVFRTAIDVGDDRAAGEVYGGPLLPGTWDDWVIEQRRVLEDLALHALHRELENCPDPADQISVAQRILRIDRVDELAHRSLIEAQAAVGNRSGALRAFHTCTTVLDRELGVRPGPETLAAYETIRTGGPAGEAAVARPEGRRPLAILIGREVELTWLTEHWNAVASDGGRKAALVAGESGIGKSRLVDAFATQRERERVVVLRSRAYETDAGRTLAPVMDWIRALADRDVVDRLAAHHRRELARLLPQFEPSSDPSLDPPSFRDPADARALLFDATAAALAAADPPLLVVVDDIQWCGPDTIDFLGHLLRRGPVERMLLALTRRDHEQPADSDLDRKLADLRAEGLLDDRRLARLQPVHTAQLARATTDHDWTAHDVAQLHVETAGHPLFVIEVAKAGPGGEHLTSTVRGVIERRLGRLNAQARELLDVAAVFGRRFSTEELAHAARTDEDTVIDALDELWQLELVVAEGVEFDFGHDLFRETVLAGLSPARSAQLHRRVAAALVAGGDGTNETIADRLAEHYERAGMPDETIGALALAANRANTIGIHDRAIHYLERALDLLASRPESPTRDRVELDLLTDLGAAHAVVTGYGSEDALRTWERASAISGRLGTTLSGPVLRGLALATIADCRFERAIELGRSLCALDDPIAKVEGDYVLGVTRHWQGDFRSAERHLLAAMAAYDPAAAPVHRALYGQDPKAVCACRLAAVRFDQGRGIEADELLDEAETLADSLEHNLTQWYVWSYRQIIDRAVGRPTTRRPPPGEPQGFFLAGDPTGTLWQDALAGIPGAAEALDAIVDGWRRDGHHLQRAHWLLAVAELRLRRDDPAAALMAIDEADAFTTERGQGFATPDLHRLRAWALRVQGDDRAADWARSAVQRAEQMEAAGTALRARTELLRCTSDAVVADEVSAALDALRSTHHGRDMTDAEAALAET